jgi:hypothetical protein
LRCAASIIGVRDSSSSVSDNMKSADFPQDIINIGLARQLPSLEWNVDQVESMPITHHSKHYFRTIGHLSRVGWGLFVIWQPCVFGRVRERTESSISRHALSPTLVLD